MERTPHHRRAPLALALLAALPLAARADDSQPAAQTVVVTGTTPSAADPRGLASSDTTQMLQDTPGMSVYTAGGVSGLPSLRGLADTRIKVRVDGGESTAACGNHMNAPLTYIDPTQVTRTTVMAGISPVSAGGDNIAGVIDVRSADPLFASGPGLLETGYLGLQGRTVDDSLTKSASATLASDAFSATYTGATTQAESYKDGEGDKVLDTLYKSTNQSLTLGTRTPSQLWVLKVGEQVIPYQGFANEFMDMTRNHAVHADLAWSAQFGWGRLQASAFWQNTEHVMGFFSDERSGNMPMDTHGRDASESVEADVPLHGGTLKIGEEVHHYRLDDWWPALAGSMMMGPDTYQNINDGHRNRAGAYGEWEGPVAAAWTVDGGVRLESVHTDTGDVQSYGCGMMCASDDAAAAAFNASDRARHDTNLDASLLTRYAAAPDTTLELGIARKTRSPDLYERYAWGRDTMAMAMIGWFGDANGYVGNIDLKPEVADTVSATLDWHDASRSAWFLRVTPFFTTVHDYIDVDTIGSYSLNMMGGNPTQALLQFANHDAQLYGVNASWLAPLATATAAGDLALQGKFDFTRGRRTDGGGNLYHIMPPNLSLAVTQSLMRWTSQLEWQAVGAKTQVDARRLEPTTPAYSLVNLGTQYAFRKWVSLEMGIRNVFNRQYQLPLGGVDIAAYEAQGGSLSPMSGPGRSFNAGVRIQF